MCKASLGELVPIPTLPALFMRMASEPLVEKANVPLAGISNEVVLPTPFRPIVNTLP